jgi:hypothetical protein
MNSSASSAALYNAWRSAGLSDNQARIMMAETGRENSWNLNTIFVGHPEPVDVKRGVANPRRNFGLISWNGDRRNNLINLLSSRGLWQNGRAVQSQATLDAMAQFAVREIATNPLYAPTKRAFLQNPNVDYSTATRVLGNNYIKWRYNDPAYAEGHARRDGWYQKINNLVGAKPNLSNQRYPQQYRPQPTFQDPTAGMDSFQLVAYLRKANKRLTDNQIFEMLANNPGVAGREVRSLLATGQLDPRDIAKTLGLKKTSFAPEVTTYFDSIKKGASATTQPIRQPSPQKTFLSSAVDDFFTSQSKPTEEANTSKNQFSIAGAVDDYFAKGSNQAPANLEGDSTSQDNKSFLGSAIDDFFTTSSQARAQPSQQPQVPQVQVQPQPQAQQPTEQAVPTLQTPSLSTFVSAKQPTLESDLGTDTTTTNNNDYTNNVQRFGLQA